MPLKPSVQMSFRLWPGAQAKLYEEMKHYRSEQYPVGEFVGRLILTCPAEFRLRLHGSIPSKGSLKRRRPAMKVTFRLREAAVARLRAEMRLHAGGVKSPVSEFVSRLIEECPDSIWKKVRESMDVKYQEWE